MELPCWLNCVWYVCMCSSGEGHAWVGPKDVEWTIIWRVCSWTVLGNRARCVGLGCWPGWPWSPSPFPFFSCFVSSALCFHDCFHSAFSESVPTFNFPFCCCLSLFRHPNFSWIFTFCLYMCFLLTSVVLDMLVFAPAEVFGCVPRLAWPSIQISFKSRVV